VICGIDIVLMVAFIVLSFKGAEFIGQGSTNYGLAVELFLIVLTGLFLSMGELFVLVTFIARPVKVDIDGSALWGKVTFWALRLVFGAIGVGLLFLLYRAIVPLVSLAARDGVSLSGSFYAYLCSYAIFTAVALLLFRNSKRTTKVISEATRAGLPTFTVKEDAVVIDFKKPKFGVAGQKYEVILSFDEIDSITPISFRDAYNYYWSRNPEVTEAEARYDKDIAGYVNGKIDKPSYYIARLGRREEEFSGAIALIRGPSLFYFIAFDADSISGLLSAYNAYKNKNTLKIGIGK
jgi:hypothetical protein